MELSLSDRIRLINQYKIRVKLSVDKDEIEHYNNFISILSGGFVGEYRNLIDDEPHIYEEELTAEDCSEVRDILSMFDHLKYSWDELSDIEKSEIGELSKHLKFLGFCRSSSVESKMERYVKYLYNNDQFKSLLEYTKNEVTVHKDFDSLCPVYDNYKKLLIMWKEGEYIKDMLNGHGKLNKIELLNFIDCLPFRGLKE